MQHVRKMRQNPNFQVVPYWTRLQVGVKVKVKGGSGKQVWATTSFTPASFPQKMELANLVDTCFCLFRNGWTFGMCVMDCVACVAMLV